jgi:hypothetical protein
MDRSPELKSGLLNHPDNRSIHPPSRKGKPIYIFPDELFEPLLPLYNLMAGRFAAQRSQVEVI